MDRKIYELTNGDAKKITVMNEADYHAQLAAFDENKSKLGKKFGMAKRDFAAKLLRSTVEYYQGKGQGALDLASGVSYAYGEKPAETLQNAYNLGYYTGYTSPANLRDLIATNPNFSHLK